MEDKDKLFIVKILALLHDPPYKSYCIYENLKGNKISHEAEAKKFREKILRDTILEGIDIEKFESIVRNADIIAAGFDRWLLNFAVKTEAIFTNAFVNIFNPDPKHCVPLTSRMPSINELREKASEIANVLNNIIKKVTERVSKENAIKFTYLILYALLEPLCYAKGLPPSLADTRVPTHTVIDHVYATTTAVNMVFGSSENKPLSGFLVCIDFPGIHEFIDSARKAGDFWAGSWIISEITWRLTEKMIDIFGPDVVISPTTRMNPYFYFRYFINLLKKYCGDDKVINEIREIIIKFLENITGDKIPLDEIEWQPLIPGTVFLILPKNENIAEWTKDEKSIVEYISQLYTNIWEKFVDTIVDFLSKDTKGDTVSKITKKVFYKILDTNRNVIKRPPIGVRIAVISIEEIYNKLVRCLKGDKIACDELGLCHKATEISEILREEKISEEHLAKLLTFHVILTTSKLRTQKIPVPSSYWIYNESEEKIKRIWKQVGGDKKIGWIPCSQCGKEPAILILRKEMKEREIDYNEEDINELLNLLNKEVDKCQLKDKLRLHFKPGEALGPYCLLKRATYLYALSKRGGKFHVSTDDIAIKPYLIMLNKLIPNDEVLIRELGSSLAKKILTSYETLVEEEVRETCIYAVCFLLGGLYERICDIEEALRLINTRLSLSLSIERFVSLIADATYDIINLQKKKKLEVIKTYFNEVCGYDHYETFYMDLIKYLGENYINSIVKELARPNRIYAIVYSDGDNVGKIHRGIITISCDDYVRKILETLEKYGYPKDKRLNKIIETLNKSYSKICRIIECLHGNKKQIMVSPTYKTVLSASIMITALKDICTISNKLHGMTIFSGGDDAIALIPVDTIVNVLLLRKNYEGDDYFHYCGKYPISAAIPFGRSISVRMASLFDLMSEEITKTGEILENEAKESKWIYDKSDNWEKDTLVLSFSRSATVAHFPLRIIKYPIHEELRQLLSYTHILLTLHILSPSISEDFEQKFTKIIDIISKHSETTENIMEYLLLRNVNVPNDRDKSKSKLLVSKILGKAIKTCTNKTLFEELVFTKRLKNNVTISSIYELINLIKLMRLWR